MTIKGLTDRGQAFPQIGDIRKGDKGGKNGAPRDLNYFRVELDQRETESAAVFAQTYGPQPTEINILLPFNEIERCWDAWCEAYTAGRMVARSDGETFLYLVDIKTGAILVRDGLNDAGQRVPHREVVGRTDKSVIKCRPVGRLKVIIPELRRLAYLVVHTTSVIDIRNISEQLEAIKAVNAGRIVGIPLVLRRRPREVSVPLSDGSKARLTKWMLSIEADPRWTALKIEQLDRLALPDAPQRRALPNVPEAEPEYEDIDGRWVDDPDTTGDWIDAPAGEQEPEWTNEVVSRQTAQVATHYDGIAYWDMDEDVMKSYREKIVDRLAKNGLTQDKIDDLKFRLAVIDAIIAYRNQQ